MIGNASCVNQLLKELCSGVCGRFPTLESRGVEIREVPWFLEFGLFKLSSVSEGKRGAVVLRTWAACSNLVLLVKGREVPWFLELGLFAV